MSFGYSSYQQQNGTCTSVPTTPTMFLPVVGRDVSGFYGSNAGQVATFYHGKPSMLYQGTRRVPNEMNLDAPNNNSNYGPKSWPDFYVGGPALGCLPPNCETPAQTVLQLPPF